MSSQPVVHIYRLWIVMLCLLFGAGQSFAATWSVKAPAILKQTDQWIQVHYDKTADKVMDLIPAKPIVLPGNLKRIKLWYANALGQTEMNMVIKDADGKLHVVPMTHDTRIQPWADPAQSLQICH